MSDPFENIIKQRYEYSEFDPAEIRATAEGYEFVDLLLEDAEVEQATQELNADADIDAPAWFQSDGSSLTSRDPTMRENWADKSAEFLSSTFGMDRYDAQQLAKKFVGTEHPTDADDVMGIGILDFLGPGELFGIEEGLLQMDRGLAGDSTLDTVIGGGVVALSALASIPILGVPFKLLKKGVQSEVARDIMTTIGEKIESGVEITQQALIDAGQQAEKRLVDKMKGTTLSANPVGAIGDVAVAGAGKLAQKLKGPVNIKSEGGITFPAKVGETNLRLHLKRIEEIQSKGKVYPGGPKNERTVIKAPKDSNLPDVVIGKVTFDDWTARIEKSMSAEEINAAAKWYDDVFGQFRQLTGGDPGEMDVLARAWLSGQQNSSPKETLTNVLFIYEQMQRGVSKSEIKGKGLPSANSVIKDILFGDKVEKGVGQKISDFIDSGEGKNVRSIMGNKPDGGQPFVVDVHTGRDTGLVDKTYLNFLRKLGYEVPDGIVVDLAGGGIKGAQYENRALWGQHLTEYLNSKNWMGRSDWEPREVQAIGWMQLNKLYSGPNTGGDVAESIAQNTQRISMEVDPGAGSPWAKKFGDDYANLDEASKISINDEVTAKAIDVVGGRHGVSLGNVVHGTGGWELFQNPSTVQQALASKETAIKVAAELGYLLNQTEVWVNSSKNLTKNPKHYAVNIIEDGGESLRNSDKLKSLFEAIIEAEPNGLFRGYQPIIINGKPGIKIIIDDVAIKQSPLTKAKAYEYILDFANNKLSTLTDRLEINAKVDIMEADLTKLKNDWTKDKDGGSYKSYFGGQSGEVASSRAGGQYNIDTDRGELENLFRKLIEEAKQRKGKGNPKPSQKINQEANPPPVEGGG